jgi:hypothetical protein
MAAFASSDAKQSQAKDNAGRINGPGAMRKYIDSTRQGKTRSTLVSSAWKSGHAPAAEGAAWNPLKLMPSEALLRASVIMEQVRLELRTDPLKRYDFGSVIASIDRYWLDMAPALLEESNGVTSGDVLWLALTHLFCVDRNETKTVMKIHSLVLQKANSIVPPYKSVEQYALAVLKSELRYRVSTFHSGKEIYREIQKIPPPAPPDPKKLMVRLHASESGVEILRMPPSSSSSSSSSSASESPAKEKQTIMDARDLTPLGVDVVSKFSNTELLAACSASVLQFKTEDVELVSLSSRLYFATMITRMIRQLAPLKSIPDQALASEPILCRLIALECKVTVDHIGTDFREFLVELYVPACCYSRCVTTRGSAAAKQKTVAKLQCTQKELYPTEYAV